MVKNEKARSARHTAPRKTEVQLQLINNDDKENAVPFREKALKVGNFLGEGLKDVTTSDRVKNVLLPIDELPRKTTNAKKATKVAVESSKSTLTLAKLKKQARKPPNLVLPSPEFSVFRSPPSQASSLDPLADEFQISEYASSLPKADATVSSLLDSLSLSAPVTPPALTLLNSSQLLQLQPCPYSPDSAYLQSLPCSPTPAATGGGVTATVENPGYISFQLNFGVVVDISSNGAIRLINDAQDSSMALSSCTKHLAVMHPKGRVLVYKPRVEVQTEDKVSVKNAKIYPRGISFTANNMALVYLLDEAGARSTSDMFHDLYASHIADTLFEESCLREGVEVAKSIRQLDNTKYWRNEKGDFWVVEDIQVHQTRDGMVIVERKLENGENILMRSSPANGKLRFKNDFVQITASCGEEAHVFLRVCERRLHYNGQNTVFTVRNAGHSAGFDEEGELKIF